MKNVGKSVLVPFGLAKTASATNAAILNKNHEEVKDVMEIFKSLKESGLSKGVLKTTENEAEKQNNRFLSMLISLLSGILSEIILAG